MFDILFGAIEVISEALDSSDIFDAVDSFEGHEFSGNDLAAGQDADYIYNNVVDSNVNLSASELEEIYQRTGISLP